MYNLAMRFPVTRVGLWLCFVLFAAAQIAEQRIDFESDEAGQAPRYFTSAVTGDFKEGKWIVEDAEGAPSGKKVLAQRDATDAGERFALCLYDSEKSADADVEVRLKSVGGTVALTGGVVARCIDRNNYYLARADVLANNVRLYAVVQGQLTQLAAQPVGIEAKQWHKLRLVVSGRHLQIYFNDVMVAEADDDALRDPGQVGVWTQADSVTLFDDLIIKPVAKKEDNK